eukprot:3187884-Prymnesium_polylepis.1
MEDFALRRARDPGPLPARRARVGGLRDQSRHLGRCFGLLGRPRPCLRGPEGRVWSPYDFLAGETAFCGTRSPFQGLSNQVSIQGGRARPLASRDHGASAGHKRRCGQALKCRAASWRCGPIRHGLTI